MVDVVQTILPPASTAFERAWEQATAPEPRLADAISAIAGVKLDRLPGWVPFLLWELGVSDLTPYVPDPLVLLDEGEDWQIERDTFAAVARALGWVDVVATIEEAPTRREWWNAFQLALSALPASDEPILTRIDRLATLSSPFRSDFRRGFFGYDARAIETDTSRLDDAILEDESGVRLREGGPLWSFGRADEATHDITEPEATGLGIWIEPIAGSALTWADIPTSWQTANFPWSSNAATQRRILMAGAMSAMVAHAVLRDGDGDVIGYRRARAVQTVNPAVDGAYSVGGTGYAPAASGESLYVEAQTDFGDGAGQTVAEVGIIFGGSFAPGVADGALWIEPGGLIGGVEVGTRAASVPLRLTVRDRFKTIVRF